MMLSQYKCCQSIIDSLSSPNYNKTLTLTSVRYTTCMQGYMYNCIYAHYTQDISKSYHAHKTINL